MDKEIENVLLALSIVSIFFALYGGVTRNFDLIALAGTIVFFMVMPAYVSVKAESDS